MTIKDAAVLLAFTTTLVFSGESSATSDWTHYRKVCEKAANDPQMLQTFRSRSDYFPMLEYGQTAELSSYLKKHALRSTLKKGPTIAKIDEMGNPDRLFVPHFGMISGTTLRYTLFADHILRLFELPEKPTVVEIGAGFGGQCYVFSKLKPFKKYYFYDLPEVEKLIATVMKKFHVNNTVCMPIGQPLPESTYDLFISNYGLSECNGDVITNYFNNIVVKADRGYVLYNSCGGMHAKDFVALLEKHNMNPKMSPEPVPSAPDNVLITWDRTQ